MYSECRECGDVVTQIAAVRAALSGVGRELLKSEAVACAKDNKGSKLDKLLTQLFDISQIAVAKALVIEGGYMAGANTATFTDQNFGDSVLKSDKPVMVDFWATWCGPCVMAGPVVDELADDYVGKVAIGKLDVDANQATAQQYGVMSIPTVIMFKDGKEVARKVGFAGRKMYEDLIKQVV